MRIGFTTIGNSKALENFLRRAEKLTLDKIVEAQAERGVAALAAATPKDTGKAAASWGYEIVKKRGFIQIFWTNSDIENGYPVAVMIQYGHGTGTGGYVQGIDYINPAMRPIFDNIAQTVWKAVISG